MTQVFFYHGASDKLAAACALISGAYAKKKSMLVYAPDAAIADGIDRMLWTHAQLGFVPHCRADSPLAAETPILIADSDGVLDVDASLRANDLDRWRTIPGITDSTMTLDLRFTEDD